MSRLFGIETEYGIIGGSAYDVIKAAEIAPETYSSTGCRMADGTSGALLMELL